MYTFINNDKYTQKSPADTKGNVQQRCMDGACMKAHYKPI